MGFRASTYRVMIASPGDVASERDIVEDVIVAWNDEHAEDQGVVFLPVRWERSAPRQGAAGQDIVNEDLVDISDVLIAIIWKSIGRPTRNSPSGTVEEVRRFAEAGKLHGILFKKVDDPDSVDPERLAAIREFKEEVHAHEGDLVGLSQTFENEAQLRTMVHHYLTATLPRLPTISSDAGLTLDQLKLLRAVTRKAVTEDLAVVNTDKLDDPAIKGFSKGRLQAALWELARRDLVSIQRDLGVLGFDVSITPEGIREGTRDFEHVEQRVRAAICRMTPTNDVEIADSIGLPPLLIRTIARGFADRGLVNALRVSEYLKIRRPTAQLCGWDKDRERKACVVIGPHFPNRGDEHRQSFIVDLLNEGEFEARDIKVVSDVDGEFSDEPHDALPFVIPRMTSEPNRRYRTGFSIPWPARGERGDPIQGQQKEVRLKVTFRDGLEERDTAVFTVLLRNNQVPNRWSAEELRHKAKVSPICQGSRMEAR